MFSHLGLVIKVVPEASIIVAVLPTICFTFKIVVPRCAFLIAARFAAMLDNFLYPPFLDLMGWFDRLVTVLPCIVDTGGNVIPLCLEHIRKVELKGSLIAAHYK